jgi:hypothetical protein
MADGQSVRVGWRQMSRKCSAWMPRSCQPELGQRSDLDLANALVTDIHLRCHLLQRHRGRNTERCSITHITSSGSLRILPSRQAGGH